MVYNKENNFDEDFSEKKIDEMSKDVFGENEIDIAEKPKTKKIATTRDSVDLNAINQKTLMRIIVIQYLFSCDITGCLQEKKIEFNEDIFSHFLESFWRKKIRKSVMKEMQELCTKTIDNIILIDEYIQKYLGEDWSYDRIPFVNRAILRVGVASFLNKDLDHGIIFDEFIKITKWFSERGDHKFVNAILEKISLDFKGEK